MNTNVTCLVKKVLKVPFEALLSARARENSINVYDVTFY